MKVRFIVTCFEQDSNQQQFEKTNRWGFAHLWNFVLRFVPFTRRSLDSYPNCMSTSYGGATTSYSAIVAIAVRLQQSHKHIPSWLFLARSSHRKNENITSLISPQLSLKRKKHVRISSVSSKTGESLISKVIVRGWESPTPITWFFSIIF